MPIARFLNFAVAALAAAVTPPAAAQKTSPSYAVAVDGLPDALSVTLRAHARFCASGQIAGAVTELPMNPVDEVELQVVQLPTGTTTRLVHKTVYRATISPDLRSPTTLCTLTLQPTGDNVVFTFRVAGQTEAGVADFRPSAPFGAHTERGPFSLKQKVEMQVQAPTFGNTAIGPTLTRGLRMAMTAHDTGLFLQATHRTLSFLLPPSPSGLLTLPRLQARIFRSAGGRDCITSGSKTVCRGDVPFQTDGGFEHGGVRLYSIDSLFSNFAFQLTADFPVGSYTMESSHIVVDPMLPLVDDVPTWVQLGRIVPHRRTVSVQ